MKKIITKFARITTKRMACIMLIVSIVGLIIGVSEKPVEIKADDYVVPQAFEAAHGSTFSFDIKPGQITRVRTAVTSFDRTVTDGQNDFVSFGLETSDKRLVATDLKLIIDSGQYWPSIGETVGENLFQSSLYVDPLTIDYKITSSEDLPEGEYSITLYGNKYKDSMGAYVQGQISVSNISNYTTVKIPIVTYTLVNKTPLKAADIRIERISLSESGVQQGTTNTLVVRVMNKGQAEAADLVVDPSFDLNNFLPDYEMKTISTGAVKPGELKTVRIPFRVGEKTENGLYAVKISVSGKDVYGKSITPVEETIYITVGTSGVKPSNAPSLSLSTKQNYKKLKPSTEDSIIIRITNNGDKVAKKVRLTCESGFGVSTGLTKNYTADYIEVEDIPAGETVKVEVPFIVSSSFARGAHELQFMASFTDEEKNKYESEKMTMYVEHYKTEEITEVDGRTYLQISGVAQTPSVPSAGEKVTVSFNVKNKGTEKITNLHFYGVGLSATNFQPVSGEPYQNEGSLEAGEQKKITMTFRAGEDIPKGVNALTVGYDYFGADNKQQKDQTVLYVLNVQNHKFDEIDVGRPKIIVSDYVTEPDILRAGETFDFSYTLKNTHTGKEARNIKITLSQADGVLAPAQGTNIFYIDKLDPTQEVVLSLPLKSRADTVTGDYAVVLKLEYEYDDMSEVDKEHGGVSEENTLKLRVIENYRPVIENIYIDSYQGVMVGQPVDLSFEFYNMGKSTLGNVYVTVEGDFALANNAAMSYVGAVQGYGQEYLAPQVVPLVGGEAHGTVTIHFEDSNGDEQTKSADFTAYVDDMGGFGGEGEWNGEFPFGGEGEWNGEFPYGEGEWNGEFPFGEEGDGEGEGMPWWVWLIIGVGSAAVITVVVIIIVKKAKKRKALAEDEEDNEDI